MEAFSALLTICARNSPCTGEFPAQRPVTRSFDILFDLRLKNGWVNNHEAGDLRRHHAHYDITVMANRNAWTHRWQSLSFTDTGLEIVRVVYNL